MRKAAFAISATVVVAFVASTTVFGGAPTTEKTEKHEYIGATKCKMCHNRPDGGEQYAIWEKSAHAKAYTVLASDEAKKLGKAKGIDNPQEAAACLKCHVTGYGAPADLLGSKYDKTEGVTCEACHGAGGDYYKKKTMVGVFTGEIDPASVGLVMPDEKTCVKCHNEESPTFKSFDYKEMVKKIAHPIPGAKKAEYKKAEG
jgi:hypothetical protein